MFRVSVEFFEKAGCPGNRKDHYSMVSTQLHPFGQASAEGLGVWGLHPHVLASKPSCSTEHPSKAVPKRFSSEKSSGCFLASARPKETLTFTFKTRPASSKEGSILICNKTPQYTKPHLVEETKEHSEKLHKTQANPRNREQL